MTAQEVSDYLGVLIDIREVDTSEQVDPNDLLETLTGQPNPRLLEDE